MCGRYASSRSSTDLAEEFDVVDERLEKALEPDYNVAPTKEVPAVLERLPRPDDESPGGASGPGGAGDEAADAVRQLRLLRWGLVPSWAKDPGIGNRMINARSETVAEKPAFRRAWSRRRCLLPADGYFEWYPTEQKTKAGKPRKQPFFIRPADGSVLAMAGLYEIWRDPTRDDDDPQRFRWTCTVLTTEDPDALGHIHDRMPQTVPPERWAAWLDPRTAKDDLAGLLLPAQQGDLEAFPVSVDVGNVRNNGPHLVQPLPLDDVPDEVQSQVIEPGDRSQD